MCGIAGGILFTNQDFGQGILEKMTSVIGHRGPDDKGILVDGSVGLGFRRLSIIDLSPLGHQPMSIDNGRVWIVFNGEIYNFEQLRIELQNEDVTFKSKSDTEVILQLYLKYGSGCFAKLNGMFGLAIWDSTSQKLILARDRVGEKPLYYYQDHEKLLFASELKSIYQCPGIDYTISPESLAEYFSYGFIGAPRTIYKTISKLEPGCCLTIGREGKISMNKYWDWLPSTVPPINSINEAKQLIFDKVDKSIRLRMHSDVPLGAFLSGGIDSTIIVARMAEYSSTPVKTFTIGFKDKEYDESEYATIVASRYNTDHHLEVIDPNYADIIESIISNFDEPFGDSSALPTYVVSKMIGNHVTVALSGDGGDEVFGGYDIYKESLSQRKFDKVPPFFKKAIRLLDPVYPDVLPGRNYLRRFALANPYDRFIERYKLISDPERKRLMPNVEFHDTKGFKKKYISKLHPKTEFLSVLRYNDISHYLEGDILVKVDRTTMLNSVESRAPFLDHELIELSFTLSEKLFIQNNQKKIILKEAFKKYIPEELFNRPKKGFSLPLAKWFRSDLYTYFKSTVFNDRLKQSGLLDLSYVEHLFNIHQSKKRDLSFHLWLILAFAIWYNQVYLSLKNNDKKGLAKFTS